MRIADKTPLGALHKKFTFPSWVWGEADHAGQEDRAHSRMFVLTAERNAVWRGHRGLVQTQWGWRGHRGLAHLGAAQRNVPNRHAQGGPFADLVTKDHFTPIV